ncbi:MAG: MOP flippase family protein [Deltaproteobacteria bacterium]|nr:MOP flippase family protein [Deltaproteobacteria bacterium]
MNGSPRVKAPKEDGGFSAVRSGAVRGVRWTTISAGASAALAFVQTMILARLLTPTDFGLMSMLLVVTGFGQLFSDMGVSNATIYRQDVAEESLSSLFWMNIACGACFCGILQLAAPLVAVGFSEARLEELLRIVALSFLVIPVGQQCEALLKKELRFDIVAGASVGSSAVQLLASVAGALGGLGVGSLVLGYICGALARVVVLVGNSFRTHRPRLHFAWADLRGYLSFGVCQMVDQGANYANNNISQVLIGAMLGPKALGYFTLANELAFRPAQLITPVVTRVLFPVLARLQTVPALARRTYFRALQTLCTVNAPVALGMAAVASLLIPVLYGEQWGPSVRLAEILALVSLLRSTGSPVGALLLAKGRTDLGMYWSLSKLTLQPLLLYGFVSRWGAYGAVLALLGFQAVMSALSYRLLLRRLLGPCARDLYRSIVRPLCLSLLMAGAVWGAKALSSDFAAGTSLILCLCVGLGSYMGLLIATRDPALDQARELIGLRRCA